VTDDELREACATVATYAEAAEALGIEVSSISVRAGKLGLWPGLAIPGESPKARGGRAALRARGSSDSDRQRATDEVLAALAYARDGSRWAPWIEAIEATVKKDA
jgi:hypothetical protein